MSVLLDTNVLSELLRPRPEAAVLAWVAAQPPQTAFVSAVTQAEMLFGAQTMPAGKRRLQLGEALGAIFGEDFVGRVLPFDTNAAAPYAHIVASRRRLGRPIGQFDAQIAAIAVAGKLKLATRNVADFEGLGLVLINPWTSH
jgi:toxin FitB